jgi:hypothetical protein
LPPAPEREPKDEQVEPQAGEEEEQEEDKSIRVTVDIPIRVTADEQMMTIIKIETKQTKATMKRKTGKKSKQTKSPFE